MNIQIQLQSLIGQSICVPQSDFESNFESNITHAWVWPWLDLMNGEKARDYLLMFLAHVEI